MLLIVFGNVPSHIIGFIKKYEIIELKKSKYKFILINDPKTLNGGLDIRSIFGFHTDIIDGFAHYAEHIFFGGTKNITELDLFNLVSQYNEMINAYTADEETGFQFFGSNYTFETLLEYISNFMQYPLFNKTYLEVPKIIKCFDEYQLRRKL